MKIRTRLALRFTIIVASILGFFAFSIYFLSEYNYRSFFFDRLHEKAYNYFQLISETDELNPDLIKIIDKNTAYLPDERIIVVDKQNQVLFDTKEGLDEINTELIKKTRKANEFTFTEDGKEILAKHFITANNDMVVIVSANDEDSRKKLLYLKYILIIGFIGGTIVTMIAGWIFANKALQPISGVVSQVEKINATKLSERVKNVSGNDEIGQLAETFNRMLERIHKSFELQKSFVSNSSHELRTPLTSITGQLEVALMNKREPEEYKQVMLSVLDDIKSVNKLTNGLLELAQAEMDFSRLRHQHLRMDELLWATRTDLLKRFPEFTINIQMQGFPDDERKLMVFGSEHLLKSALQNIVENGCKFSSKKEVNVTLEIKDRKLEILCQDEGIGIHPNEINNILQPFFRGSNARSFPGHGLGLSLAHKIIQIHEGEMQIESVEKKFTCVKIILPSLD